MTQPSGRQRTFDRDKVIGRKALAFDATDEPGIYRVAVGGRDGVMRPRRDATFVVNVDAAESDLTPHRSGAPAGSSPPAAAPRSPPPSPKRRVELWHTLGAALLFLLLGEALLLRRK